MSSVIKTIEDRYKKHHVADVKSGDTVKVHQKIREGNKERIQIFEGLVIRTDRSGSHSSSITVRRLASGVGVEKTYLLNSPLVVKVEITKRSKVRRNYLSYMRARTGKSARLSNVAFDREAVNAIPEEPQKPETAAEPAETTEDEKPTPETEKAEATAETAEQTTDQK